MSEQKLGTKEEFELCRAGLEEHELVKPIQYPSAQQHTLPKPVLANIHSLT
mgnify:CR=1 FL=1